jgi:hypothetical protein
MADITSAFNRQITLEQSCSNSGNSTTAASPANPANSTTSNRASTTSSISLHQAWEVMFTDLERSDYLFDDFMEDYMVPYSDNTEPSQQQCSSQVQDRQPKLSMTLGEIFSFLEANQ